MLLWHFSKRPPRVPLCPGMNNCFQTSTVHRRKKRNVFLMCYILYTYWRNVAPSVNCLIFILILITVKIDWNCFNCLNWSQFKFVSDVMGTSINYLFYKKSFSLSYILSSLISTHAKIIFTYYHCCYYCVVIIIVRWL